MYLKINGTKQSLSFILFKKNLFYFKNVITILGQISNTECNTHYGREVAIISRDYMLNRLLITKIYSI